ncbi:unnamed protein product [Hermetia illucens]|uniref:TIR domain-containing protein n=1 Tax=Hermetia illucens TaxID=343691 RepID=A0A7R8YWN3_HERIL|nr:toll-like receptor 7 [Hermetia illucens]CAD7088113.1 unnamed protein product [Hermetia illucens]
MSPPRSLELPFSRLPSATAVLAVLAVIWTVVVRPAGAQCSWEYQPSSVKCHLRILESQGLNLQVAESADRLDIECSETLLFQSELPAEAFARLPKLSELQIESCRLLKLPPNAFKGLNSLRRLAVNTRNSIWGAGKSLEVFTSSLNGLRELQVLDLSENNLRQLPEGVWCPLGNLQILNLTHNRLRSADSLGFGDLPCTGAGGSELQVLDVSHNELRSIPDNWGISRLRRLNDLKLEFNNITEISPDALSGLASLKIFNISYNHLETLPTDIFAGNKQLREIHLQHNQIYDLPKGIFHHLEELLVLDLSGNQLTSHNVDNATFSGLIRLVVLNLANNALTRIGAKTFSELYFLQNLDLRNNSIGHVEEGAFLPLYNLHTLNLAENRLHTLDNKLFNGLFILTKLTLNNNLINIIESQAFRNCSDLKELDLSSNQLTEVPEAIQDLAVLKTLDLGENQISGFQNGSFRNLNQLTGLRLIDNQIGNITIGMFWDLPRLSVLNLAKNRVQAIERGSFDKNTELEAIRLDRNLLTDINGVFATLASLLWLNLSENHLVWFDYAFIPSKLKWLDIHGNYIEALGNYYKLQEEIRVKTLDASHNRITEIGPMSVPNTIELLFINNNLINTIHPNTFVDKTSLTRVDLYANMISKLQLHNLRVAPAPDEKMVPEFYLGGNPFECDCSMEWLQRADSLTSRQHPRIMDLANIECLMPHSRSAPIRALTSLSSSDFLCKYDTHCFALCHCCDFDACDCEMTCPTNCSCYNDDRWGTNIVDCGRQNTNQLPSKLPMDVTDLYLDGNNLPVLQNQIFIGRKNLRSVYLNASNVMTVQNQTFAGLAALEILHLENNKLQTLQGSEFSGLSSLKELYLHNNQLSFIGNNTLADLTSLRVLRIDNNRLVTFPTWQLHNLQQKSSLTALAVGRNSWSCHCKFLQELTEFVSSSSMVIQDAQDIYCVDGAVKRELDLNASAGCNEQYAGNTAAIPNQDVYTGYIPLLAAVLVLIVLIIILIVVFVFRESVRMWLFAHYGVRVCESRFDDAGKLYDAIILHSAKDYEFVCRTIAGELEHGRPPFRLCIQQRDLPPDASHLQIVEATRASRKMIVILTRNFLQTEWIRTEFRSAFHEALRGLTSKLVFIEETDVGPEAEEVAELQPYLKSIPSNRILTSDPYFWEKLRYAIPIELSPRGNNYTIDHHERFKQPVSPGVIFRQAPPPPAYYQDGDETNYSSATTATPSPRPARHPLNDIPMRPPSEHIYSSIDSEYSGYDHENLSMIPSGAGAICNPQHKMQKLHTAATTSSGGHPSNWRPLNTAAVHASIHRSSGAQPQPQTPVAGSSSGSGTSTAPAPAPGGANSSGNTNSGQAFLV